MQWSMDLGRIDIMYATAVLSRFRTALRKINLAKIENFYGYLKKYTSASINFNNNMSIYDNFNTININWGNVYSADPEDLPCLYLHPMGKPTLIYIFVDSKLMDDLTTGRSQTGIIRLLNKTPIDYYSKLKYCV